MSDWYEYGIIVFIVCTVSWIVWRGGQSNPSSTGELGGRVAALDRDVHALNERLAKVGSDLGRLERDMATTDDIRRIEVQMAGDRKLAERTYKSIDRIEQFLVGKGLNQ